MKELEIPTRAIEAMTKWSNQPAHEIEGLDTAVKIIVATELRRLATRERDGWISYRALRARADELDPQS